jgi:hypothetical protein
MNKYVIGLLLLIIFGGVFFLSQKNKEVWEHKIIYIQNLKGRTATPTVTLPRLENYPDKAIRDKVNKQIEDIEAGYNDMCGVMDGAYTLDGLRQEWKDAGTFYDKNGSSTPVGDVDHMSLQEIKDKFYANVGDVSATTSKNSDDIFSIHILAQAGCPHTAHPSSWDASVTFDLKTGNKVSIEDLFIDYEKDLRKIVKIAYGNAENFYKPDEDECSAVSGYFDENGKESDQDLYFNYHIAENGQIVFSQDVPNVEAGCVSDQSIPISKLKVYIKPDGILSRMLQ